MKNTRINIVLFLFLVILTIGIWVKTMGFNNQENVLLIQVKTVKSAFVLGEVVNLDIFFQNVTNRDISIASNPIESGAIKVFISKKGGKYRRYAFGGTVGAQRSILKPGETNVFQKTVIYSGAPKYSHLNKDAAKAADEQDNRILTDYAFPEAGNYSIKVISYYKNIEDLGNIYKPSISVESAPIQITVVEPVGEDREIWNFIKDKPEFAYFMESDEPPYNPEKRALFQQNLQQIIDRHPNSFIVRQLKQSIEKFNQNEARRNDPRNKIIRQPNRPDPQ